MTLQLPRQDLPSPSVDVAVEATGDVLTVHVRGEVDIATHEDLASRLDVLDLSACSSVHVDLAELDFCDSTGVRQLLAFVDSARSQGRTVELHDAGPQLARLLALVSPLHAA